MRTDEISTTANAYPSYYAVPYSIPASKGNPRKIPGLFTIYEYRDGHQDVIIERISNRGDRLGELLRRGIPLENARILFYQMDGK